MPERFCLDWRGVPLTCAGWVREVLPDTWEMVSAPFRQDFFPRSRREKSCRAGQEEGDLPPVVWGSVGEVSGETGIRAAERAGERRGQRRRDQGFPWPGAGKARRPLRVPSIFKDLNPDVFVGAGYFNDAVRFVRAEKEVALGSTRKPGAVRRRGSDSGILSRTASVPGTPARLSRTIPVGSCLQLFGTPCGGGRAKTCGAFRQRTVQFGTSPSVRLIPSVHDERKGAPSSAATSGSRIVARQKLQVFVIGVGASTPLARDLVKYVEAFKQADRLARRRRRQAEQL